MDQHLFQFLPKRFVKIRQYGSLKQHPEHPEKTGCALETPKACQKAATQQS